MGAADVPPVVVEVLGPLRLFVEGESVDVRGPKRRAVLAMIALAEGRTVTVDQLMEALWPAEAAESGRAALHAHVSRLRAHFGPAAARLETGHDGYRIDLGPDGLDVARARALLAAARPGAQPEPARAFALLRQAHALWRGPMLADLTDVAPIATAVHGFERLHAVVTDALIASAVDARQADAVVGLASAAVAADPLREQAVLLLMRVLAATAQAPEALRTGREYRHRLAEETGLDPSPALGSLERDIAGGAAGPTPTPGRLHGGPPAARPTTRLIGREPQVAALHRLLAEQRLVSVVGPGGVGKSRVAFEVARSDESAIVLLLAPVTDPTTIPHALAAALNLTVTRGDVLSACLAVLGDKPGLLVIDNCEHLLDAVRDMVESVLANCSGLTVLATSRVRLGLGAEYAFRLAPLPVPGPDDSGRDRGAPPPARVPSVAVFLDRAARVRPGRPPSAAELRVVCDIVRRLDGMPLAIELAAARLSSFSLADLHRRLDRSLDLLGDGRPSSDARHRTLRATIEWSYGLLTEDQRRLFRHLSIFVDGVDLDDAEHLAADLGVGSDPGIVLADLVDASMIDADIIDANIIDADGDGDVDADVDAQPLGRTRYRMLATMRAFGLDRLVAAGEDDAAARRLLRWAVEFTTRINAGLTSEHEAEADAVLRRELANLRAAWQLALRQESLDAAVAMVIELFDALAYRDLIELRGWAQELAEDPALVDHPRAAAVFGVAAEAAYLNGDYPQADTLARVGLERAGDDTGAWFCLSALSVADLARGAYPEVVEHSLAAAGLVTRPRENLGIAALATAYAGDLDAARTLNQRGLDGAVSPTLLSWGAYVEAEIESRDGRPDLAEQHYVRAIDLARASGATFLVGVATVGLLTVRVATGRIRQALTGYREVIDYFARTGNWTHQWATLRNLADLLRRLGDEEPATQLAAAADNAPDAPADNRSRVTPGGMADPPPNRAVVLEMARLAIDPDRHLAQTSPTPVGSPADLRRRVRSGNVLNHPHPTA